MYPGRVAVSGFAYIVFLVLTAAHQVESEDGAGRSTATIQRELELGAQTLPLLRGSARRLKPVSSGTEDPPAPRSPESTAGIPPPQAEASPQAWLSTSSTHQPVASTGLEPVSIGTEDPPAPKSPESTAGMNKPKVPQAENVASDRSVLNMSDSHSFQEPVNLVAIPPHQAEASTLTFPPQTWLSTSSTHQPVASTETPTHLAEVSAFVSPAQVLPFDPAKVLSSPDKPRRRESAESPAVSLGSHLEEGEGQTGESTNSNHPDEGLLVPRRPANLKRFDVGKDAYAENHPSDDFLLVSTQGLDAAMEAAEKQHDFRLKALLASLSIESELTDIEGLDSDADDSATRDLIRLSTKGPLTVDLLNQTLDDKSGFSKMFRATAVVELEEFRQELAPLLRVLPKSSGGVYSMAVACYAVHTFFYRSYGWRIKGLESSGRNWNASSILSSDILFDLPWKTRRVLTKNILARETDGFTESEVGLFAYVLRALVNVQDYERLGRTYKLLGLSVDSPIPRSSFLNASTYYFWMYVAGPLLASAKTVADLKMDQAETVYPSINETFKLVEILVAESLEARRNESTRLSETVADSVQFGEAASIIHKVGRQSGEFQNAWCQNSKAQLVNLSDRSTGRVYLSDFYKAYTTGNVFFGESVEYLQSLGALDEGIPGQPRLIIPNWVFGPSNCLIASESHDVCCQPECEMLIQHIHDSIGAPVAPADTVVRVARDAAVSKGLKLSPWSSAQEGELRVKLNSIAKLHHGKVPLSGRLFWQWMHHAFPNECPFPHLAYTTDPQDLISWDSVGSSSVDEAVAANYAQHKGRTGGPIVQAPWIMEEEQLPGDWNIDDAPPGTGIVRCVTVVAAMSVALLTFWRSIRGNMRQILRGNKQWKKGDFGHIG